VRQSADHNFPVDHEDGIIFAPDIMAKVFRIVGITGSLRKDSWNTKLLRAYEQACKDEEFVSQGVEFEFADWSR